LKPVAARVDDSDEPIIKMETRARALSLEFG